MFISKEDKEWLKSQVGKHVSETRFEIYIGTIRELKARIESLEEALGLSYSIRPSKPIHTKKGGPERPE